MIHKLKYEGVFGLAKPLADLMLAAWPQWQTAVDLVMPIPLHKKRHKKRGYNQSELLASHFGQKLALPVNTTNLAKNTSNETSSWIKRFRKAAECTRGLSGRGWRRQQQEHLTHR